MKSNKHKVVPVVLVMFLSIIALSNCAAGYWVEPPPPANQPLKLAFFIYSSDVASESIIRPYADILGYDYGYISYVYEDPNIYDVFDTIDNLEDSNDKLFFYFYGHGYYDGLYSRFHYAPGSKISSLALRNEFDQFEAGSIAVFIEACQSGEFVDMFEDNDKYLIMTTADEYHNATGYSGTLNAGDPSEGIYEGVFSHYFWSYVASGDDAITAFTKTREYNAEEPILYWSIAYRFTWYNQYAQITTTYAGYNFF